MKRLTIILAVLVLAACSGKDLTEPTGTPGSGATSTPDAAATDTPATGSTFASISLSGTGSKVPKFTIPTDAAAIAVVTNKGKSGNFIVESLDASGQPTGILVNAIGAYSGTVLFDESSLTHSVAFKVTATGAWTIKVEPVGSARTWSGSGKLSGKGDDVVRVTTPPSGLRTATMTHSGKANFIVYAYTAAGFPNVLVNEIGSFTGQEQLPDGTVLLAVTADGTWTVTPD